MRWFVLGLLLVLEAFGQPIPIPKEWKGFDQGRLLLALDAGKQPFLVRRLTMSTVDRKFAGMPGPMQEDFLWEVEKMLAADQGRRPVSFLIWDSDLKEFCDLVAIDGKTHQVIVLPPLLLAVSFSHRGDLGTAYVYARVAENSKVRINLLPEHFRMAHVHPKLELQPPMDPAKVAGKIRSRARWWAALGAAIGAMQTTRVTTASSWTTSGFNSGRFNILDQWSGRDWSGTYSGTSSGTGFATTTTTAPDYEARARAEAQAQAIQMEAAARADEVSDGALRAKTLTPGTEAFGAVYFKRDKKGKFSVLAIPIGTFQFEFGVQWR